MFDVGFSEMIVIGIVALIVIGPEKLPKVARTVGLLVGRMQRYVGNVKSDIQREMQFEDLQKLQQEIKQGLTDTQHEVMETGAGIKKEVAALERDIESAVTGGSSLHATLGNSTSAVQSELDLSVSQDASTSYTETKPLIQPELASEESKPEIAALESAPPWPVPESQVLPAAEQLHADAAEPSIQASPGTTSITGTSSITGTTAVPDATRTST